MVVIQTFVYPTEGITLQHTGTKAVMNDRELGEGTLFITESLVSWVDDKTGQGFSLQYPHIALHAVSRDLTVYPKECLYLMIDADIDAQKNGDSDDSDAHSEGGMTELRFVPDDKGLLDAMFHAMTSCQALHPDPQDSASEEESEAFEDADEETGEPTVPAVPLIRMLQAGQGQETEEATNGICHDEPMETDENHFGEEDHSGNQGQFEDADSEPKPGD